ncbi:isocitrate lyase/PEP mutase family protein [Herbidospora sp. RD11066]
MPDQHAKGLTFAKLHETGTFVLPNPWDAGTARLLAGLGYAALGTTSGGLAFTLGRRDGAGLIRRDETLRNISAIATATDLPVSADLENGFGDVAETIRLAAEAGAVGGSIEDATGDPDRPVFDFDAAVERVAAAAAAARALPVPFTFTARAENFLYGRPDLDDTIRRLCAFEEAGADVLYAPGLPSAEAIREVCAAVSKPVNVLVTGPVLGMSVADLAELGVRRVSLGSALSRAALTATLSAAREIADTGTFGSLRDSVTYAEANDLQG